MGLLTGFLPEPPPCFSNSCRSFRDCLDPTFNGVLESIGFGRWREQVILSFNNPDSFPTMPGGSPPAVPPNVSTIGNYFPSAFTLSLIVFAFLLEHRVRMSLRIRDSCSAPYAKPPRQSRTVFFERRMSMLLNFPRFHPSFWRGDLSFPTSARLSPSFL